MRPTRVFDPQADAIVAEVNGAIIGFARSRVGRHHRRQPRAPRVGRGRPALAAPGDGDGAARAWNSERARVVAAGHDTTAPRVRGRRSPPRGRPRPRPLYRSAGFSEARWFFHMVARDLAAAHRGHAASRRGRVPGRDPMDQARQHLRRRRRGLPRPLGRGGRPATSIRQVARGSGLRHRACGWSPLPATRWPGRPSTPSGPPRTRALGVNRGWLESVFVRRPWRRHGLARAIVGRSLELLRERAWTRASWASTRTTPPEPWASTPHNGFVVDKRLAAWRRPLEVDR